MLAAIDSDLIHEGRPLLYLKLGFVIGTEAMLIDERFGCQFNTVYSYVYAPRESYNELASRPLFRHHWCDKELTHCPRRLT